MFSPYTSEALLIGPKFKALRESWFHLKRQAAFTFLLWSIMELKLSAHFEPSTSLSWFGFVSSSKGSLDWSFQWNRARAHILKLHLKVWAKLCSCEQTKALEIVLLTFEGPKIPVGLWLKRERERKRKSLKKNLWNTKEKLAKFQILSGRFSSVSYCSSEPWGASLVPSLLSQSRSALSSWFKWEERRRQPSGALVLKWLFKSNWILAILLPRRLHLHLHHHG